MASDLAVFEPWAKIPRLIKTTVISEKIDGTNAAVVIRELTPDEAIAVPMHERVVQTVGEDGLRYYAIYAQSRKRIVSPRDDNFGFAQWVDDYRVPLVRGFGVGRHFGEWWGKGIQRGYGADGRFFSPFNTGRWDDETIEQLDLDDIGVRAVPVLYITEGFDTLAVDEAVSLLATHGTFLPDAERRHPAEGVIVYHSASGQLFKRTLENDDMPKSLTAEQFATAG